MDPNPYKSPETAGKPSKDADMIWWMYGALIAMAILLVVAAYVLLPVIWIVIHDWSLFLREWP
jgi:hypothetical protein